MNRSNAFGASLPLWTRLSQTMRIYYRYSRAKINRFRRRRGDRFPGFDRGGHERGATGDPGQEDRHGGDELPRRRPAT